MMRGEARRIRVRGQVQGVGFRPFVWRLAQAHGVCGRVANDPQGVLIHAEGGRLEAFVAGLSAQAPAAAVIDALEVSAAAPEGCAGFVIATSTGGAGETRITPDLATCPDCLAEIAAPGRRQGYAFANCTNCGPRFSIVEAVPYDRAATTMRGFALCPACAAEYADPDDRRFHAQPIACPECGPRLSASVEAAAALLRQGGIVALKGLGGFHLACDAADAGAVAELRRRKARPVKPLAVMGDAAMIRAHAAPSAAEMAALQSAAAPIVLLLAGGAGLAPGIAPGLERIGWMLPATPLHHLLLAAAGRPLVMTSANPSGRPMLIEANAALATLADLVLDHDRPIARRLDDSVGQVIAGRFRLHRRARGFAPRPLHLHPGFAAAPPVLAFGGHLKATLCLTRGREAIVSQHIGDLDDPETLAAFGRAGADLPALLGHRPQIAACDAHPGYRSTALAEASGLPLMRIAHHHAHMAAVMAEHGLTPDCADVAGIILDGIGLGPEGALLGGEVWRGGFAAARPVCGLLPVPLPGGDAAAREPWRNLMAHLDAAGLAAEAERLLPGQPLTALRRAVAAEVNAPLASSAGRLFDAMAALLGVAPPRQSHEAEAAMALESLARGGQGPGLPFGDGPAVDPRVMWKETIQLRAEGVAARDLAYRFHAGLAEAFARRARAVGAPVVVLGGGCMHNAVLLEMLINQLDGVEVLAPSDYPAGDGGLALGQAAIAAARLLQGHLPTD